MEFIDLIMVIIKIVEVIIIIIVEKKHNPIVYYSSSDALENEESIYNTPYRKPSNLLDVEQKQNS